MEQKQKQFWTIVTVAASVAILVSVVMVSAMSSVSLAPQANSENRLATQGPLPDLIVGDVNHIGSACGGVPGGNATCSASLIVTVQNIGNATAIQSTTNVALHGSSIQSIDVATPAISSGSFAILNVTVMNLTTGHYNLTAMADSKFVVGESNENNNLFATIIRI